MTDKERLDEIEKCIVELNEEAKKGIKKGSLEYYVHIGFCVFCIAVACFMIWFVLSR